MYDEPIFAELFEINYQISYNNYILHLVRP